jgi:hypothetical protein
MFQFLDPKNQNNVFNCKEFFRFLSPKNLDPGFDPDPGSSKSHKDSPKSLDLDPDSMNRDPQHCTMKRVFFVFSTVPELRAKFLVF